MLAYDVCQAVASTSNLYTGNQCRTHINYQLTSVKSGRTTKGVTDSLSVEFGINPQPCQWGKNSALPTSLKIRAILSGRMMCYTSNTEKEFHIGYQQQENTLLLT